MVTTTVPGVAAKNWPAEKTASSNQGVGFIGGAAATGGGDDGTCQGLRGVVGGDADGVVDQLGLGVEHHWAGVDLGQRQPGRYRPVRRERRVESGLAGVHLGIDGVDHRVGQHDGGSWFR